MLRRVQGGTFFQAYHPEFGAIVCRRGNRPTATTHDPATKRKFVMKRLMLVPLTFLWFQAAQAASPTIVDDQYVTEAIARGAVIWDVRPADAYAAGHIAGAINIDDAARVLRDANTEDFIAIDRIEKILGAAGLDPKRETIVYGSRGTWNPYFGLYTMQYFSGSNVRVYHEGIEGWAAAGRAISREAPKVSPVALKLEV